MKRILKSSSPTIQNKFNGESGSTAAINFEPVVFRFQIRKTKVTNKNFKNVVFFYKLNDFLFKIKI